MIDDSAEMMPGGGGSLRESVLRWAGEPGPALILAAAREKLEAGRTGDRVAVPVDLDDAQRRDVGRMLGAAWQASAKPVTLGVLRDRVREAGAELHSLLEHLGGPLRDLPAERAAARGAAAYHAAQVHALLVGAGVPEELAAAMVIRRWLGGSADREATANAVARVLSDLEVAGGGQGRLLADVAGAVLGDPHALDRDRTVGRSAARAVAGISAHRAGELSVVAAANACASSSAWRAAWASAGVACDQVSSTVLALNVPVAGLGPAGALLRAAAAVGEPVWVTARALADGDVEAASAAGWVVRVCENPVVVEAAADRWGAAAMPLVCTYGRPSTAAWALLEAMAGAGASFLVSADRDKAGREIASELLGRLSEASAWLPDEAGLYEEDRLRALVADLARDADDGQPKDSLPSR